MIKALLLVLLLSQVSCMVPGSYQVGITVSSVSLAFAVPHYFVFNTHLRILDFLQIVYLFSLIESLTFANLLSVSWL